MSLVKMTCISILGEGTGNAMATPHGGVEDNPAEKHSCVNRFRDTV